MAEPEDLGSQIRNLELKLMSNIRYQKCLDEFLLKFSNMRSKARDSKFNSKKTLFALKFKFPEQREESAGNLVQKPFKSIKQFGAPYFKDDQGFSPSKNRDEIIMERKGYLNLAQLQTPVKWQQWEMKLLDETVRKVALGSLRRPFVTKKTALLDKLNTEKCAKLSTALTELQLEQVDKEIEKLSGEALFELLNKPLLEHDWCRISVTEFEGMRPPLELRAMWRQCLVLILDRKPWTNEETKKLREVAAKFSFENWSGISCEMGGRRSAYQCFLHYQSILNKYREGWSPAEDKKLKTVVNNVRQGKFIPWDRVAELLPGRSITQIIMRWTQRLNPMIKSGGYTERDDMILSAARSQKLSFRQISELLPGRTESQLRNRYIRLECFKPSVPWIPEDDQKLLALVKQFKSNHDLWAIINEYFPERDRQQLKGRLKRLTNEAAGVKNSLPQKGKKSIWSLNKRRTTPIFNAKNVIKFAINSERAGKSGRRSKKKGPLDLEFDQVFRSHYAQPKGRRKKYHPNAADPVAVIEGRRLSEMLGVHFNWSCERKLEAAAANDPDFHNVLNVYRQLKMMHNEEGWDPQAAYVSQLMPPNVCTLIGLRTLLLEERSVLAMSLQGRQQTPTYLKGVIAKADQGLDSPELDEPSSESGAQNPAPLAKAEPISPALAMSLFKQRFFSIFLWPSMMSQLAPSMDYKKDLFEGEKMACASSDEDEAIDNLFLDFATDDEEELEELPGRQLTEFERKEQLREKWLQYREQKMSEPEVEGEKEVPAVLQKKRRLPKKRGRKKIEIDNWLQNHIRNNLDC